MMPIPDTPQAHQITAELTRWATDIAVWRHAGNRRAAYGVYGRHEWIEGRDLTAIQYVIGTGGALVRLGIGKEILGTIKPDPRRRKLLPSRNARVLLDRHYIMAAAGVLSQRYPEAAKKLLRDSLSVDNQGSGSCPDRM